MFNTQRPEVLPKNSPWLTRQPDRTVLAVVHNVTAATRLFDVLPLLATDPRIQVHFTCPESSPFHGQIAEYFTAREVTPIPWDLAATTEFDLAVAASHGGPLHDLNAPLIILPHGMGYNKYLDRKPETGNRKPETGNRKPETGNRKPVFGMSPEWLLHEGELVASSLVFSHTEQLDRLRASCPAALDAAVVTGDAALDRMLASIPLRRTYRDAFGVQDGQRLIFVSSTWGPDSLYGTAPALIQRLRAELPLDDYVLAVALHPNTWSAHSPWQIHRWLGACARAGVVVVPPEEGWRAALVAADLVVGDHGSVTFYAGALGKPVLLANSAGHTVDPASAVGRFVAAADHVEASALLPQVEHAIARGQSPEQREAAALASSAPLKSFALLREEFYRLLALPEPDRPALTPAVPVLHATPRSPAAQAVEVTLTYERGVLHATARRFAAELAAQGCPPPQGAHLVVSSDEPDQDMLQLADIVVHEGPGDAKAWITDTLSALPGAMLSSMPVDDTTWLVGTRDGGLLSFTAPGPHGRTCASVVLSWLISGHSLHAFPQHVELLTGTTRSSGKPIACTYQSATA